MDPVTAAGLTLAILPIIISAFENYENTFGPIVNYRRYRREAKRFETILRIQKTAFENEGRLLLATVTREEDDLVKNLAHPLWRNGELDRKLTERLGDSFDTCVATLDLINETLREIQKETGGFEDLLKAKEESGKGHLHLFRQKLKISFSKPRLDQKIDELRKYNGDLRVLTKQITRLHEETRSSAPSYRSVTRFRTVQKASQRLYDTFSNLWSCKTHTGHLANICLDMGNSNSDKIRFNMALAYLTGPQASIMVEQPLWFSVESLADHQTNLLADTGSQVITETLRVRDLNLGDPPPAKRKKVTFDLPESAANTSVMSSSDAPPDLCMVENLCVYFQDRMRWAPSAAPCMGYLQKTKTFKHFIYPSGDPQTTTNQAISLQDALVLAKTTQLGIPLPDKLRIAKLLALAVLQFHSTPWLRDEWRSRDVLFFGINDPLQDPLQAPYLNASFYPNVGPAPSAQISGSQSLSSSSLSIAPNAMLYSLGVTLIELGFDAPLHDLQQPEDLKDGVPNQYSEFWTAKRLGAIVSNKLGAKYGRIVSKCLNCDFGLGGSYELGSPDLQNAFFHDVVRELDMCLDAVSIC